MIQRLMHHCALSLKDPNFFVRHAFEALPVVPQTSLGCLDANEVWLECLLAVLRPLLKAIVTEGDM